MSDTSTAPTVAPSTAGLSPADLAARYGLTRSGARPPLREYARQLWGRRSFILAYASARNRALFTESVFGQAWQVLTPLLNAGIYYLIFGELLQTKRGVHNFVAFLVTGVFIFYYTQRSMIAGATAVTARLSLIRALYFPRATLPLATTVIELQQLLWSMAVLFIIILSTGEPLRVSWLLAIPALVLQTIFNVGVAFILARLTTMFRDLQQLLPFMLRTLLYFSGVFWSIHRFTAHAPHLVAVLLDSNPTAIFIQLMRGALITHQRVQPDAWPLAAFWALLAFGFGFVYFWRAEESYGRG